MQNSSEVKRGRFLITFFLSMLSAILTLFITVSLFIDFSEWSAAHCWLPVTKVPQNPPLTLPSQCTANFDILPVLLLIVVILNVVGLFTAAKGSIGACYAFLAYNLMSFTLAVPLAFNFPTGSSESGRIVMGSTMLLSLFINLFPLMLMFRERFRPKVKQKHVPKIEPAPNPWLVSYVLSQQGKSSRYEIDLYLLRQGYPAAEIESAWKDLAQPY